MSAFKRVSPLRFATLEQRDVPAGVSLVGGWLNIDGTNGHDTVSIIDLTPQQSTGVAIVYFNGQQTQINKQSVTMGIKFRGFDGNDTFSTMLNKPVTAWGGDGNDTLSGNGYADKLDGQDGADVLNGYSGNDSLYGGNHNDTINGGVGNDYITGQAANDWIDGGEGNDNIYGYTGNDTLNGGDGKDTLSGWDGADILYGGDGNDRLYGHDGNDDLHGQVGNDWMHGGDDDDEMFGSDGNDSMDGGNGDDELSGGDGNDNMLGGSWDDTLNGGDGNDWMTGQSGHDNLRGGDGNDTMYGYTGNDVLIGDDGNDSMSGYDGHDMLYGREGNDTLSGGAGRDGLMGGNGVDSVDGGADSDRYLTIGDHNEIVSMSGGDATIQFGGPKIWTYAELERMDAGMKRLHERTGNTDLLRDPSNAYNPAAPKAPRLFVERAAVSAGGYDGFNNGSIITIFDEAFAGSDNWAEHVIIHEIGHHWDQSTETTMNLSGQNVVTYFRSLSDWRTDLGAGEEGDETTYNGEVYVKADGDWWYRKDAVFTNGYAKNSPYEDFAETLTAVVMGSDFANGGDPFAPTAKRAWLTAWLNNV